jgi:hypothetical protein
MLLLAGLKSSGWTFRSLLAYTVTFTLDVTTDSASCKVMHSYLLCHLHMPFPILLHITSANWHIGAWPMSCNLVYMMVNRTDAACQLKWAAPWLPPHETHNLAKQQYVLQVVRSGHQTQVVLSCRLLSVGRCTCKDPKPDAGCLTYLTGRACCTGSDVIEWTATSACAPSTCDRHLTFVSILQPVLRMLPESHSTRQLTSMKAAEPRLHRMADCTRSAANCHIMEAKATVGGMPVLSPAI